ncbi:MAG: hypothetical protein H2056_02625 [Sphingopyxis sp.]|nr:hypothetical protein [Sphingopyxis sp.]
MVPLPEIRLRQSLRDLGPPSAIERVTIARILLRYGYPAPPPPAARSGAEARRPW